MALASPESSWKCCSSWRSLLPLLLSPLPGGCGPCPVGNHRPAVPWACPFLDLAIPQGVWSLEWSLEREGNRLRKEVPWAGVWEGGVPEQDPSSCRL